MNIEPFTHIAKAFKYIEEQSADKEETKVNIYLLAGDHFMTTDFLEYYYLPTKSSIYSYNQNIVMQPAFWGETLGGHTFGESDSDWIASTEKLTIYYKMGNEFSFPVPQSLTVKSLIFDAIDSSINPKGKLQIF